MRARPTLANHSFSFPHVGWTPPSDAGRNSRRGSRTSQCGEARYDARPRSIPPAIYALGLLHKQRFLGRFPGVFTQITVSGSQCERPADRPSRPAALPVLLPSQSLSSRGAHFARRSTLADLPSRDCPVRNLISFVERLHRSNRSNLANGRRRGDPAPAWCPIDDDWIWLVGSIPATLPEENECCRASHRDVFRSVHRLRGSESDSSSSRRAGPSRRRTARQRLERNVSAFPPQHSIHAAVRFPGSSVELPRHSSLPRLDFRVAPGAALNSFSASTLSFSPVSKARWESYRAQFSR